MIRTETPLSISVKLECPYDDSPDLSHLGEIVKGAPDSYARQCGHVIPLDCRGREYSIANSDRADVRAHFKPGNEFDAAGLVKDCGFTPGEADRTERKRVREDCERFMSHGERWSMVGCVLTVTLDRNGWKKRLNMSVWGVESDSGDSYFAELFGDLASEVDRDIEAVLSDGDIDETEADAIRAAIAEAIERKAWEC